MQVFSLAVLLSSVFVYNQLGSIDAIAIERLAMTCELAKRIKQRSAGDGGEQARWAAGVPGCLSGGAPASRNGPRDQGVCVRGRTALARTASMQDD